MCPPGVDQTTRTPQRWSILCPEQRERYLMVDNDRYRGFSLSNLFAPDMSFDVMGVLASPIMRQLVEGIEKGNGNKTHTFVSLGKFNVLSPELIDMVIDHLIPSSELISTSSSPFYDLIALGLTSQTLWSLVIRRIQNFYVKTSASWAGKQLVLQGNWSTSLPPPLVENPLVVNMVNKDIARHLHLSRGLFYLLARAGTAPVTPIQTQNLCIKSLDELLSTGGVQNEKKRQMEEDLRCDYLWPKDRDWILRNLSTREYVSEAELRLGSTKIRLVDALLAKIAWTNNPSAGKWHGHLAERHDSWAGCRFDIVTREVLDADYPGSWVNVTGDVAKLVNTLR